jgi:uncharacterized protein YeaC (DUF1315 family)
MAGRRSSSSSSGRDWDTYSAAEETARSRSQLAIVLIMIVALAGLWMLYWFVSTYYGDDGVRLVGIVFGIALIITAIIGLGVFVMWVSTALTQKHHNNVLQGLVRFQESDDRGEVARTVASGVAGVMRSGNQVDTRMLAIADRLSRERQQALQQQFEAQRRIDDQQRTAQEDRQWVDSSAEGQANWEW